jgi:4-hydroxy-3-polyprenylbenzoate decarboxylase
MTTGADVAGRRIVVAVTGASGAIYAARFLKACLEAGIRVELVASDYGRRLLIDECGWNLKVEGASTFLDRAYGRTERPGTVTVHSVHELADPLASGSQAWDAMVVVPCSMKTLSGIAHGAATNLIERAADVTLKEGRPLVLVPRECPLSVIHLENLVRAARAGARIVPAMPAFYFGPRGLDDLADFVAGRALSVLGIPHALYAPWNG